MRTTLTSLISEQMVELERRLAHNQQNNLPTADLVWVKNNLNELKTEAIRNNCWEFPIEK